MYKTSNNAMNLFRLLSGEKLSWTLFCICVVFVVLFVVFNVVWCSFDTVYYYTGPLFVF